jgi:hypothetical protein
MSKLHMSKVYQGWNRPYKKGALVEEIMEWELGHILILINTGFAMGVIGWKLGLDRVGMKK